MIKFIELSKEEQLVLDKIEYYENGKKFINTIQQIAKFKKMDLFTGFAQNDLPEFLLFMIDCFHNSLSRHVDMTIDGTIKSDTDKIAVQCFEMTKRMFSKEYSEIWQMFYGIHVSQIISIDEPVNASSKVLSSSPEPFCIINLLDIIFPPDCIIGSLIISFLV